MKYIKIQFTKGLNIIAFQEINAFGEVENIKNEAGEIINISEMQTESIVIDENPTPLNWFIHDN